MSDILDGGPSPFPCAVCEQQEAPVITSTGGPLARILRGHTPIHTFKESQCDAHVHTRPPPVHRARETRNRKHVQSAQSCARVRFDVYSSILDNTGEISFRLVGTTCEFRLSLDGAVSFRLG